MAIARKRPNGTGWCFFNRLAEVAGEYLRKGSQVYVEGKIQTRKWQDQSGQDRYTTEIVANEMQMLGGRAGAGDAAPAAGGFRDSQPAPSPEQNQDFKEDDIPF